MCDGTPCPCNLWPAEAREFRPRTPDECEDDLIDARADVARWHRGLRRLGLLGGVALVLLCAGLVSVPRTPQAMSGAVAVPILLGVLGLTVTLLGALAWSWAAGRGVYARCRAAESAHRRGLRQRATLTDGWRVS